MIIADENLHQQFIDRLTAEGFDLFSIRDQLGGISDLEVAYFARDKQGLIVTEDKDFGELVYAHNIQGISVVFLRYDKAELDKVGDSLVRIVGEYLDKIENYFITITADKIRISKL